MPGPKGNTLPTVTKKLLTNTIAILLGEGKNPRYFGEGVRFKERSWSKSWRSCQDTRSLMFQQRSVCSRHNQIHLCFIVMNRPKSFLSQPRLVLRCPLNGRVSLAMPFVWTQPWTALTHHMPGRGSPITGEESWLFWHHIVPGNLALGWKGALGMTIDPTCWQLATWNRVGGTLGTWSNLG